MWPFFNNPQKYIKKIIICIYKNTVPLEVCKGLKQCDVYRSPVYLALKSVIRKRPSQRQRVKVSENHTLLAYADDIMLMKYTKPEITNEITQAYRVVDQPG